MRERFKSSVLLPRIVIDRLRDRYGNSGRERDEIGEREKRKRTEVESCFPSRQIEFLRGGFALTFPSLSTGTRKLASTGDRENGNEISRIVLFALALESNRSLVAHRSH